MDTKTKSINLIMPVILCITTFLSFQNIISQTIQAEDYIAMDGVQTETTSDSGGGLNVGWLDNGDWMAYNVNIPAAGNYKVSYRVASNVGTGRFQLEGSGGNPVYGTLDVPNTGGWQNWTTISHNVTLPAGEQVVAIAARGDGWNINWFNIAVSGNELPSPWASRDIGGVATAGAASYSNGTFEIKASGRDIWNGSDEFRYLYQDVSGDKEITAKVNAVSNTNAWAKGGVMFRESTNANSKFVMVVQRPDKQISMQWRSATGANAQSFGLLGGTSNVKYVRLKRQGNQFTGYYSTDGNNYVAITTITCNMAQNIKTGLAVTSHNDGVVCTSSFSNVEVKNVDNSIVTDPTITYLFQNSYQVFKKMRLSNGIYLDAMSINVGDKPAAIAGNGIGLMALCIADAMYQKTGDGANWEYNAENLAATTIQTFVNFKNNGKTNQSGMFYRYFNPANGDPENYEFSTIDNAIFAIGLTMCKNYFSSNTTLVNNVNYLMGDMDYPDAISGGNGIYMVLDWYGNGSAATIPFNEYMLVSWMAKNASLSNPGYTRSNNHWNTYFANPVSAPVTHPTYGGYQLLSDGGFCSSFTILFNYYFVNYFKNNGDYMWYLDNWRKADMQFQGGAEYEWGLGAGENPGGGYSANSINNNPDNIVSPHIIAGFLPIYSQGKEHLKSLYNNGNGPAVYTIPGTNRKFLWRYSRNNTGLRCSYVQAVDFSTMLFGLASLPEYLGDQFFNSLNYPSNLKNGVNEESADIDIDNLESKISVYPTMVTDILKIDIGNNTSAKLDIYSFDGRLILNRQLLNRTTSISISELNVKGGAIVKVTSEKGIFSSKIFTIK